MFPREGNGFRLLKNSPRSNMYAPETLAIHLKKIFGFSRLILTSIGQVVEPYLSKFGFGSQKLMPPMKKHVRSNMSDPKNLKICVKKNFGYSDLISD